MTTPPLKSQITRLTLNPTWTVPPTILQQDKLPLIREDAGYLARHGMRVLDAQGNDLDPASIDWHAPRNIMLRQEAGPANPLGQVAIRFANPFSVYLHDTPSKPLFDLSQRALSSGCVRVEVALQLVDLLRDGVLAVEDHLVRAAVHHQHDQGGLRSDRRGTRLIRHCHKRGRFSN